MERIKTAIVGYGGMGAWHGEKLMTLPEIIDLTGTYDILEDRQTAAKDNGLKPYPSFDAVLEDKNLELVIIATPNDLHKPQTIALMTAGKHVVCEKPVTMSLTDLDEMIAASAKYSRLFTVHQNRRWDEDYLIVKKILDDNTLGNVFRVENRVQGSRGIPGDWRNKKESGGGMVLDWGVHLLDQILMLKPQNKVVSIYAELTHITNFDVDDGFFITLTFDDGFKALAEVGTSNFITMPRWYMTGENGTAIISDWSLTGKITKVSDWEKRDAAPVVTAAGLTKTMAPRTDETIREFALPEVTSDVRDFFRNVYNVIRKDASPIVTHAQLRRVMLLMEASFKSSATNSVVAASI